MMTRFFLTLLLLAPSPVLADHDHAGHGPAIQVGQPWAPATPPVAQVGAGYATITNTGDRPDRLLGGESPLAGRVEIHRMSHDDGLMTMRALPEGAEIPAGGVLELQPGGVHLMFLDLTQPLKAGETIPVTLDFQQAGRIEARFTIRPTGQHSPDAQAAHSH